MSSAPSALSPTRVLILGASGRIGRLLRLCWKEDAPRGIAPVWQYRRGAFANALRLDFMNDQAGLGDALCQADAVLVLAGVTPGPGLCAPDYAANAEIAGTVLEAAAQADVGKVLLTSTAAVYGAADPGLHGFHETGGIDPASDYGKSKAGMEHLADTLGAGRACCLRIGNVAGADQLLGPGQRDIKLDVFPDGSGPRRTYLGPGMLASILAQLLQTKTPLPGRLNIGGTSPVDMRDLLHAAGMHHAMRPAPAGLPETVALDCSRMRALIHVPDGTGEAGEIVRDWCAVTGGKPV